MEKYMGTEKKESMENAKKQYEEALLLYQHEEQLYKDKQSHIWKTLNSFWPQLEYVKDRCRSQMLDSSMNVEDLKSIEDSVVQVQNAIKKLESTIESFDYPNKSK